MLVVLMLACAPERGFSSDTVLALPKSYEGALEQGAHVDPLGRRWVFQGRLSENPGVLESFRKPRAEPAGLEPVEIHPGIRNENSSGASGNQDPDEFPEYVDVLGERADYLISVVPDTGLGDWLLFELEEQDPVLESEYAAAYAEAVAWLDDLPDSTDDGFDFSQGRIVGTDERTILNADPYTPGGSNDTVVAVRNNQPAGDSASARDVSSKLQYYEQHE